MDDFQSLPILKDIESHVILQVKEGLQTQPCQYKRGIHQNNQDKNELHESSQAKKKEQENEEKSGQKSKNSEPIVIINRSDSGLDIQTMVEQLLRKNVFSNDSSIFVIVPSIDNDTGINSEPSDCQSSTICIQMSLNPLKWKGKVKPRDQGPDTDKIAAAVPQGVKLSAKGKKFFMEGLPIEVLSCNKETLFGHSTLAAEDNRKKPTRNKLCQITTPDEVVKTCEGHGISTDTTTDRPCCCSAQPELNNCTENDRYIANTTPGIIGPPYLLPALGMNQNDPIVLTPYCLPHLTQGSTNIPQMQLCQCTPEKFIELLQQVVNGVRILNMQSIGCGEGVKRPETSQFQAQGPDPGPVHRLTQAASGSSFCCHDCLYPPKNNELTPTCACVVQHSPGSMLPHSSQKGDGLLIESIETGKTEKKQPSSKQKRFYSTIGTSTGPKLTYGFEFGGKCRNAICKCREPGPVPNQLLYPSSETDESEVHNWKKKIIVTDRVLGSKLNQKRQPPTQRVLEFTREHDVRYYVFMKPELFQNIMEQQKVIETTTVTPAYLTGTATEPPNSPAATSASAVASESPDDGEDPFRTLKLKIACDDSSHGLMTGVCGYDFTQESFTSW